MIELHFPWIEAAILMPLVGMIWLSVRRSSLSAQRDSLVVSALTFALTVGGWLDFVSRPTTDGHEHGSLVNRLLDGQWLAVDAFSAPLLPMAALLYLLTVLVTLRTKSRRFSFTGALASEAILLATLSSKHPLVVGVLLVAGSLWPLWELRRRGKPTRVYCLHLGLFALLMAAGGLIMAFDDLAVRYSNWAAVLLSAAVLVRSGLFPFHCWVTDLFEHASFGLAILFLTPMLGAYAAVRLVMPIAPDFALRVITLLALWTAVYAAAMSLIQTDVRRFFCFLLLSHSALVLVGLEVATPIALAGALCVWFSVGLSLAGLGLTLRSLEARTGRLSLADYHGLYRRVPMLAAFFLLTGLSSVGFPGTFGFFGTELLVDGVVQVDPFVGVAVVLAATLNGISIMRAYFRIFTAAHHTAAISLQGRLPERLAVLAVSGLILGGGLYPQAGVMSRYHAAVELIRNREVSMKAAHPAELVQRSGAETSDAQ